MAERSVDLTRAKRGCATAWLGDSASLNSPRHGCRGLRQRGGVNQRTRKGPRRWPSPGCMGGSGPGRDGGNLVDGDGSGRQPRVHTKRREVKHDRCRVAPGCARAAGAGCPRLATRLTTRLALLTRFPLPAECQTECRTRRGTTECTESSKGPRLLPRRRVEQQRFGARVDVFHGGCPVSDLTNRAAPKALC